MDTKLFPVVVGLERVIIELTNSLKRYVMKDGASELYVQKQNEIIHELTKVYNQLSGLKYIELWENIETRIQKLEELDPELNAHTIVIHTKPGNKYNYSYIEINPFSL